MMKLAISTGRVGNQSGPIDGAKQHAAAELSQQYCAYGTASRLNGLAVAVTKVLRVHDQR